MELVPPTVSAPPEEIRAWLWALPRLPGSKPDLLQVTVRYPVDDSSGEGESGGDLTLSVDATAEEAISFYDGVACAGGWQPYVPSRQSGPRPRQRYYVYSKHDDPRYNRVLHATATPRFEPGPDGQPVEVFGSYTMIVLDTWRVFKFIG